MSANPGYPGRVRVDLRLNDQQLGVIAEVLAAEGTPDTLEALLDVAVRHDMARPADPARGRPRPAGRPPTPPDPAARVDTIVAAGTGLGVALRAGDVLRVEQTVEGQCADLNAFALGPEGRPGLRFDAARTRAAHGLRVSTGATLWSAPPERPLLEIVADTAGPHDLGFPACSAFEFAQICDQAEHSNCVDLQRETQRHWGLTAADAHDPLNLWLTTDVLDDGRLCYWPVSCRRGDHVDLRALTDVLVVVNPCASDVFGSAQWELGPVRVIVHGAGDAPARPTGPEPVWRWRDMPLRETPVELADALASHLATVRESGWFGFTDAEVARALLLRWWEDAVLQLGEISR